MDISGTKKEKTAQSSQHPGSPVQSLCGPTLNICQNNQPKDWEKKVMDSQHLPIIFFPDCIPKKSIKRSQCKCRHQPIFIPPLTLQEDCKLEDHPSIQLLKS